MEEKKNNTKAGPSTHDFELSLNTLSVLAETAFSAVFRVFPRECLPDFAHKQPYHVPVGMSVASTTTVYTLR